LLSPVQLNKVVSCKIHGSAGSFDVDLTSGTGIECRSGGAKGSYRIVFVFGTPVTFSGASVSGGAGLVTSSGGSGTNTATVDVSGVTNGQRITISLLSVNNGTATNDVSVPMSLLIGDTNASGAINASDVSQTKSRLGQAVNAANFRSDVNTNGSISAADIAQIKANIGTALP
jgi:hypothetical protein